MRLPELGDGVAFGVGGTNYRIGHCDIEGNIDKVVIKPTPKTTDEFFSRTALDLLRAADRGSEWGVMGVPGPVKVRTFPDGHVDQNFRVTQIPALSRQEGFDPRTELIKGDRAVEELFRMKDFNFLVVNDGDLAAQAAAHFFGKPNEDNEQFDVIADLINGTGTGGALVRRDDRFPGANLFHPDPGLWEVGHRPISPAFPSRTIEKTISGPAVEKHIGKPTSEISAKDPIYKEVARGMGSVVLDFALNGGADLVVVSGGFAVHTEPFYSKELKNYLDDFANSHNPMSDKLPAVTFVQPEQCDEYELYGARGAMLSFLTRRAIDKIVAESN
ncbi:MAG: hypothetical protein QFB86_01445 [Patescibacteria group bacterium]|nr:hypothetical protein [Patescibacteria group bacterium]